MKSLRLVIIEDEPLIVATIDTALRKQGHRVLGDADSYEGALMLIERTQPDLVLVDIQLEGSKDGIDLACALDERKQPYLFLTSQTDPQTINRVKSTQPLGFIVKPFTESGLRSNIELAWHDYATRNVEFLLIKSEGVLHKIDQASITYLKAFDNYCYVYTPIQRYLVPHTLKAVSAKLNPQHFLKSHRSYVVNLRKVSEVHNNTLVVQQESLPMSRRHKDAIKKKLG
ncbi:LytR/AlgR family response regulator transcription factor [Altibacter sp. HG106]|uniref:LytR/AlgR family response regulator transcription factor n=1 Tax=Altibacter sp. HG106 TaxID=3023937 RepID=UPI00234FE1E7|nr:response regulator transcription factor [Altibacter sp. HG106]MDC7994725.1 response regulator transcription factor [Altibacter sp. HG106]